MSFRACRLPRRRGSGRVRGVRAAFVLGLVVAAGTAGCDLAVSGLGAATEEDASSSVPDAGVPATDGAGGATDGTVPDGRGDASDAGVDAASDAPSEASPGADSGADAPAPPTDGGTDAPQTPDAGDAASDGGATDSGTSTGLAITALSVDPIDEGQSANLRVDVASTIPGTQTLRVDWGDGSVPTTLTDVAASGTISVPAHKYVRAQVPTSTSDGSYTVRVTLSAAGFADATASTPLVVRNVAPVWNAGSLDTQKYPADAPFNALVRFTDPGDDGWTLGYRCAPSGREVTSSIARGGSRRSVNVECPAQAAGTTYTIAVRVNDGFGDVTANLVVEVVPDVLAGTAGDDPWRAEWWNLSFAPTTAIFHCDRGSIFDAANGNYPLISPPAGTSDETTIEFPKANHPWSTETSKPHASLAQSDFCSRFKRTVTFQGGPHDLLVHHDDGVRVYLDGTRILDEWTYDDDRVKRTSIPGNLLNGAGPHTLVVIHDDTGGDAHLGVHVVRR
ncbi:MAG: hypothetical protein U0169_05180 [Polyangiaceae bacterium]